MPRIAVARAYLAVGEGKAEVAVLSHVKSLYLPRGCGTTLTIRPALGRGGKGVIDYAERYIQDRDFERCICLLDTDTDWNEDQCARARDAGFTVVESRPCLEAWLLAIHGDQHERNTADWKREFKSRFGCEAHEAKLYPAHFPHPLLQSERCRVRPLSALLSALDV